MLYLGFLSVDATTKGVNIQNVKYCDLDADGNLDDVYAEVYLVMYEGVNYLTFDASLYFHGTCYFQYKETTTFIQ